MKILLLTANPRKNGYTQHVTDLVVEGIREGGANLEAVDLQTCRIHSCIGCYHCWTVSAGQCRFRDSMDELLEKILAADVMLCATPLYHYSMSSCMKTFFERTLPLAQHGFELTPSGKMRNKIRYPERWQNKRLGYISAGAFKDTVNFEALESTFRLIAESLGMEIAAGLVRPEAYLMQFKLAKPKAVKTVETALIQAGLELAQQGMVSEATQKKVCLPLAVDMPHFIKYSTIYWEHALALGGEAADLEKVQLAVVSDMRILMSEMARSFDSVAAARLRAVLQFDFPDKDLHFRFTIANGQCAMEPVAGETYDLRVTVDSLVWAKVFMREINVRDALMSRKIVLDGDKSLFTRLDRFFPPPIA